nr:helix-turn-helix domain-containing protein [Oceanococcus sp. HetDA_MAG_MS8]
MHRSEEHFANSNSLVHGGMVSVAWLYPVYQELKAKALLPRLRSAEGWLVGSDHTHPDMRLSHAEVYSFWEAVRTQVPQLEEALLGAVERVRLFDHEGLLPAACSAPTMLEGMRVLEQYWSIAHELLVLDVFELDGAFGIRLRNDTRVHALDQMFCFLLLCRTLRDMLGQRPQVHALCLNFAEPELESAMESALGVPVLTDAGYSSLLLDRAQAKLSLPFARKRVHQAQLDLARHALARRSSELQVRTEELVETILNRRESPSLERVAQGLYMSARTLQRKLAAQGLSLSSVVTVVRLRLARRYLLASQRPIEHISSLLGFKSQASFSRFFAEHNGMAPTDFRRRQGMLNDAPHRHWRP